MFTWCTKCAPPEIIARWSLMGLQGVMTPPLPKKIRGGNFGEIFPKKKGKKASFKHISKLEVTLKEGVLTPPTPEFGAYHFYQKMEMLNMANMKKEQMLDFIASTDTYINQDWNAYMELETGLWKTQAKSNEELMRIINTGDALSKLKFKQVELMEIETENKNLWSWLSLGLNKIVDTLGETGTVVCAFVFFAMLTLAVAGCAWKCWTKKSNSPAGQPQQQPTVQVSLPPAPAPAPAPPTDPINFHPLNVSGLPTAPHCDFPGSASCLPPKYRP